MNGFKLLQIRYSNYILNLHSYIQGTVNALTKINQVFYKRPSLWVQFHTQVCFNSVKLGQSYLNLVNVS